MPYLLAATLVLALVGVTALVLTGNRIADSEAEATRLEKEDAVVQARVERLSPYSQFRALHEQRLETVSSLADSRFDWERVMRELSLILPDNAWLVSLDATASPEASTGADAGGSGGSDLRDSAAGPALEISGCASNQEAVANFVTALKDIDGVTRVGLESSELPGGAEGEAGGDTGADDCRTRDFIAKFEIVVAFDAAPIPSESAEVTTSTAEAPEASTPSSEETPKAE
jgi:Tfp pilus assembly protein PilN